MSQKGRFYVGLQKRTVNVVLKKQHEVIPLKGSYVFDSEHFGLTYEPFWFKLPPGVVNVDSFYYY
jgi:hypothetical protein